MSDLRSEFLNLVELFFNSQGVPDWFITNKLSVLNGVALYRTIAAKMFADEARDLLLSQPAAEEGTPFGPEVLVYKVGGKMFATLSPEDVPARMNLKCDPERALELRDGHESVLPGYHMNKRHWNTLVLDQSLGAEMIGELIVHSYDLVRASLTRKVREALPES